MKHSICIIEDFSLRALQNCFHVEEHLMKLCMEVQTLNSILDSLLYIKYNSNNFQSFLICESFNAEMTKYTETFAQWQMTFERHYQTVLPTCEKQILENHSLYSHSYSLHTLIRDILRFISWKLNDSSVSKGIISNTSEAVKDAKKTHFESLKKRKLGTIASVLSQSDKIIFPWHSVRLWDKRDIRTIWGE